MTEKPTRSQWRRRIPDIIKIHTGNIASTIASLAVFFLEYITNKIRYAARRTKFPIIYRIISKTPGKPNFITKSGSHISIIHPYLPACSRIFINRFLQRFRASLFFNAKRVFGISMIRIIIAPNRFIHPNSI